MSNKDHYLMSLLEEYPKYKEMLFCRGYIITTKELGYNSGYPFYGKWDKFEFCNETNKVNLNIYLHNWQQCYSHKEDDISIALIGHAYNPFDMKYQESEIIKDCIDSYKKSRNAFFEKVSELTGSHLIMLSSKDEIIVLQDGCGMMPLYYGKVNEELYLSSHGQLVADICGLSMSNEIQNYTKASFYKIGITQLCGLNSPFSELTMLSPNTTLNLNNLLVERFYPKLALSPADLGTKSNIEDVLKNSIKLCTEKWDCSISLTGGVDSKMTLAAANDCYGKLKYFSYISSEAESKDATAASEICSNLGLEHTIYEIPQENSMIRDFNIVASIMDHNQAYIRRKDNQDARKRAYFANHTNIKMEIRSNVSEVGRAFYYKKLGKKRFRYPLTPRNMSNLSKRNFFQRDILKFMDNSFMHFIDVTSFGDFPKGFDESDMFYWENRMPAWGALAIQSFDISHETTIIYNNRKLLEMYLRFPLEDRISDKLQQTIIRDLNPKLFEMNISNNNAMKNKKRILLERIFFELNSLF
ncbi:asparagine synthase-related protein [Chengkuizengella axinellae]|uniref:Asparagine synthase-related protein n=1 Tax=Chengkuizengella axinellae TaxID=3064388 RepID=A0ABT9J146_9BACL|nr:asparagine synthase-related protein [Chengkuizengella sp. 2205SS18-9]MDP5274740.1 asparagine synthase-related protein [Chengkuizengella sp. 2205SS18-9]